MDVVSLVVDVPDEVERVVRAPADHPHARSQLEAFLEQPNLGTELYLAQWIDCWFKYHLQICEIDWVYVGEAQPQWHDEQERPPQLLVGVGRGLLRIIDHNGVVQGDVDGEVVAQVVGGQLTNDLNGRKTTN